MIRCHLIIVRKQILGLVEYCKFYLDSPYWYGTFGQIASESLYIQKKKQYPKYYKATDFSKQYSKRVFDCVGLIKGYLWCETITSLPVYNINQDKDVNGMKANCSERGTLNTMPDVPGVLVFMPGHVGIYAGKGKVIEARGHAYGVVETNLVGRGWKEWGKLNWIKYEEERRMFEQGQEYEALDYLVGQGRVTNKEQALHKLEIVTNENWTYIKWANDVIELNKLKEV